MKTDFFKALKFTFLEYLHFKFLDFKLPINNTHTAYKDIYAELEKSDTGKIHGDRSLWTIPSYSTYSQDPALHYIPSNIKPIVTKNESEVTCKQCLQKLKEQIESFCVACNAPLFDRNGYKPYNEKFCKGQRCQIFKMISEYTQLKQKINAAIKELKAETSK